MIVKVQKSLFTTEVPTALLYDEHREFRSEFPMTPEIMRLLAGDVKCYAEVAVQRGQLRIIRRVPEQPW